MDAQKIKFMMSIQNEIDKLENMLGSEHQDVIELKKRFEELSQAEIKNNNSDDGITSISLLPILNNTEAIIDKVNRVSLKYDIIDSEIEKRANSFYNSFPENSEEQRILKTELIKNYQNFELSIKKEDHKLAAKYIIIQLEGITNYFEQALIAFEEKNRDREYSQFEYIKIFNGKKTMGLMPKCKSIQAILNIKFVDFSKIYLVNDIRNYESHLFSNEQKYKSEENLEKLKADPSMYYNVIYHFIKRCMIEIV